jgi:hypothetical protein
MNLVAEPTAISRLEVESGKQGRVATASRTLIPEMLQETLGIAWHPKDTPATEEE